MSPSSFDAVLSWLYRTSWQVTCLVILLLIAQRLFQKQLSPRWRHNLWFLVVARLLVPAIPPSPLSAFNMLPHSQKVEKVEAVAVAVDVAEPSKGLNADPISAVQSPPIIAESLTPLPSLEPMIVSESKRPPISTVPSTPSIPWHTIAISVWTLGMAVFAFRLFYEFWKLKIHLRHADPIHDLPILDLLAKSQSEMGLSRTLEIYETDRVQSPALFGFWKTVILMPKGLLRDFSTPEIRYIFLHEAGHLKRRDVGVNWLLTGLQMIHWFNPFIWIAFARMRADRELACDALVLERARVGECNSYAKTIVKLLERFVRPSPVPGMIGILEDRNQMKTRIATALSFAPRKSFSIAAVAIGLFLAITMMTDAQRITKVAATPRLSAAVEAKEKELLWPPPLKITASVTEERLNWKGDVTAKGSYRLTIYSSNSWWRIISDPIAYQTVTQLQSARDLESMFTMDSTAIPDGTRTILFPKRKKDGLANSAVANPGTVPPNQQGMLMAWLSYCPRPKLDLVDASHMRGFFGSSEDYT